MFVAFVVAADFPEEFAANPLAVRFPVSLTV